jgi:glycosyltransferase involved in cell wall biosynthesis
VKVLHLTSGNLYGGIETYLLTLARLRHLCPEMEPHFGVCFPGRLQDELVAAGVPVYELGPVRLSRLWTVLRARWRLRRILRDTKFDVAVTHGSWPHVVFAPEVKRAGVRLVYAVHDQLDRGHWLNRWAARTPPDAVVANSRFTATTAATVFPGVPTDTVYLPVERRETDRDAARQELREELGTDREMVVILQASRLERWKGQTVHLEALGQLKSLSAWEAWFAGGPQRPAEDAYLGELKRRADELGIGERVKFLGQRTDVPRLMAAADVYCQPNTGPEPFGIVFIEALHAGLPVVTSDFGGAAEIVTPDCGILCPPGDVRAVADALRELITDLDRRQRLGLAGPTRAAELCEPEHRLKCLARALLEG